MKYISSIIEEMKRLLPFGDLLIEHIKYLDPT